MLQTGLSVLILIAGVIFLVRRADVRLVLSLSAAALFAVAGKFPVLLTTMAAEMANPETVVPICAALGFAYVLRLTDCDQHLVQLLLKPLRLRVLRFLLIPGGIVVGYLMNTTIVSQTAVAAVVGPILIPLLLANGIAAETAGSLLLLGSSMGGELFNPGAVEMRTLEQLTGTSGGELVRQTASINLIACAVTLIVYWRMAVVWEARARAISSEATTLPNSESVPDDFPLNLIKAIVPVLPLAFLVMSPYLHLAKAINSYVVILLAMLIGTMAAVLASPKLMGRVSSAFFEGAGYGYTHVISLIITAKMFTEGVKASGLMEMLVQTLSGQPLLAILASIVLPFLLAVVCGSGIAPTVAVMNVLVPAAERLGLVPAPMGATTAMAAHFGRTMSPAAAVVMLCAQLSGTDPFTLVRRVAVPLLCGLATLFILSVLRLGFR